MFVALEQFIQYLADSGVLSAGKPENLIPPKVASKDALELARQRGAMVPGWARRRVVCSFGDERPPRSFRRLPSRNGRTWSLACRSWRITAGSRQLALTPAGVIYSNPHKMIDLFENSNEMLCIANHDGYFTRVNPEWTKTLGWSAAELTGCPYLDFVHPDDLEATKREAMLLHRDSYETIRFENRYRCRDGSYRWLAWQAVNDAGSGNVIGSARDVTEQKLQSKALAAAELRFRTLANHAPVAIAQADAEGKIFYVNAKWCELAGISSDAALGFAWKEMIHPDDRESEIERWQHAVQSRHDLPPHELRFLHTSGETRWALSSIALLKGEKGEIVGQIATVEDITERKNAELALREAEQRFRAFMDNSPTIAWSKDENGRIVFLNKACEQELNLRIEDCYGKTDFDFWPPEVAKRLQENDRKVLESRLPLKVFEETGSAERPRRYWMTILFPYQDRLGRAYVGGIAIDITELKQSEVSLKAKQDLLRNLMNVQENEKQLLCHEFHDGLIQYAVGALMSLEGYQNDHPSLADPATIDGVIANLRKGIEDGRRTIRGIRPAVLDDSDLNAAIQDLIEQFSSSGMTVTFTCSPALDGLPESVQIMFYRVAQEALNNARKHSGTRRISMTLENSGGELRLEVRDFGCGFEVESARKRGFGLLGMNERVRLCGGEFLIESELGAGTRIIVRLPSPPDEAAEP